MFKLINDYILELYKSKSFITKQKSRYFIVIVLITFFSILITFLLNILVIKNYVSGIGDVIFLLACIFALMYIKKDKLEIAVNIYIGGYIFTIFTKEIIVNLLSYVKLSQFRVLVLIIALGAGFIGIGLVSIKSYQMNITLYFSILITLLDSIIIYFRNYGYHFNGDMIINFIYYFLIVIGGCVICVLQFKMNDEAIKILDNQNDQLLTFIYSDNLTGLPNRKIAVDTIDLLLSIENEEFAVLFIDIDNFKNINDNWGHQSGDEILKIISKRLQSIVILNNTLCRIGGDEFIIILKNLKSLTDVEIFAETIKKILNPPISHKGMKLYIGASVGISLFPQHGSNKDTLINNADLAMFEIKNSGGNGYKIYSAEMKSKSIDKLSIKMKLDKAMSNNEFIAYYQPILDLKLMMVVGAESLIRWKQEDKIILPIEFIPIAKSIGELVVIDNWMIKNACMQCKKWHDMGSKDFCISVNTSFKQLTSDNFIELVIDLLNAYSLPAMYLRFEITEDEVMKNPDLIIDILTQLRNIGIKIFLDDFGKGYSSLSYVNMLPIDMIKIDMSLIKNLNKDSKSMLIVKSTINMAHSLNIKIISEGIETQEQLDILNKLECDFIQGYLIGKPLSSDNFQKSFIVKNR